MNFFFDFIFFIITGKAFPFREMTQWLAYSDAAASLRKDETSDKLPVRKEEEKYFAHREWSFTLENEVYVRGLRGLVLLIRSRMSPEWPWGVLVPRVGLVAAPDVISDHFGFRSSRVFGYVTPWCPSCVLVPCVGLMGVNTPAQT